MIACAPSCRCSLWLPLHSLAGLPLWWARAVCVNTLPQLRESGLASPERTLLSTPHSTSSQQAPAAPHFSPFQKCEPCSPRCIVTKREGNPFYLLFCLPTSQRSLVRGESKLAEHATPAFLRARTQSCKKDKEFLLLYDP